MLGVNSLQTNRTEQLFVNVQIISFRPTDYIFTESEIALSGKTRQTEMSSRPQFVEMRHEHSRKLTFSTGG